MKRHLRNMLILVAVALPVFSVMFALIHDMEIGSSVFNPVYDYYGDFLGVLVLSGISTAVVVVVVLCVWLARMAKHAVERLFEYSKWERWQIAAMACIFVAILSGGYVSMVEFKEYGLSFDEKDTVVRVLPGISLYYLLTVVCWLALFTGGVLFVDHYLLPKTASATPQLLDLSYMLLFVMGSVYIKHFADAKMMTKEPNNMDFVWVVMVMFLALFGICFVFAMRNIGRILDRRGKGDHFAKSMRKLACGVMKALRMRRNDLLELLRLVWFARKAEPDNTLLQPWFMKYLRPPLAL